MSQRHILLLQILQYDSDCLYISVSNGTCILFHALLCRLFARCIAIFSFALLILHTPCETCCVNGTCHNHEGDCNFFLHNLYASFLQHQICVGLYAKGCTDVVVGPYNSLVQLEKTEDTAILSRCSQSEPR